MPEVKQRADFSAVAATSVTSPSLTGLAAGDRILVFVGMRSASARNVSSITDTIAATGDLAYGHAHPDGTNTNRRDAQLVQQTELRVATVGAGDNSSGAVTVNVNASTTTLYGSVVVVGPESGGELDLLAHASADQGAADTDPGTVQITPPAGATGSLRVLAFSGNRQDQFVDFDGTLTAVGSPQEAGSAGDQMDWHVGEAVGAAGVAKTCTFDYAAVSEWIVQAIVVEESAGTTHETRSWQSSYVVRARVTSTWASSYTVRDRITTTWASSYTVRDRLSVTWQSSYVTRARQSRTWASSYIVADHATRAWASSYVTRARITTAWQSSYVVCARAVASWASSYTVGDRLTTTWGSSWTTRARLTASWSSTYTALDHATATWSSSYVTRDRVTTTWASSYTVQTVGLTHETRSWASSYVIRDRLTTTWQSSYGIAGRATTTWASSYSVRVRLGAAWSSSFTTRARASTTWATSYRVHARMTLTWTSRYLVVAADLLMPVPAGMLQRARIGRPTTPVTGRASAAVRGRQVSARIGTASKNGVVP